MEIQVSFVSNTFNMDTIINTIKSKLPRGITLETINRPTYESTSYDAVFDIDGFRGDEDSAKRFINAAIKNV